MKKYLVAFLVVAVLLSSIFFLFMGTGDTDKKKTNYTEPSTPVVKHTHSYENWKTVTASTETEEGLEECCCECGKTISRVTPKNLPVSKGLEFTLSENGEEYSVSGIGECTDLDIVIPSTYQGLPVTSIDPTAFYEIKTITSVAIPKTVKKIGSGAFLGCSSLVSVYFPDYLKEIGISAFMYCTSLKRLDLPESLESFGMFAF